MDFVAIDFETATRSRASACEIGLTFVEGGSIVDTRSWLIKPPYNEFEQFNSSIHGIGPEEVEYEPTFKELWPELLPLINNKLLVAHNASFDMSVLRKSLEFYDIIPPSVGYACSYVAAKIVHPNLPVYDLKSLCMIEGITFEHHRAGDDSRACAALSLKLLANTGVDSWDALANKLGMRFGSVDAVGHTRLSVKRSSKQKSDTAETLYEPASDNFFYSKTVVFTGTLSSMTRSEAEQYIRSIGGIVGTGVTSKTDYLIVGQQDFRVVGEEGMSSKQKKAIQLIEKGSSLEILSEEEFLKRNSNNE